MSHADGLGMSLFVPPPSLRMQGFYVPLLRHFWWWLGGRSADKETMHKELALGNTVVVIPGGVQECMHMEPGKEVAFLKSRKGFVRIALQHGEHSTKVLKHCIASMTAACCHSFWALLGRVQIMTDLSRRSIMAL